MIFLQNFSNTSNVFTHSCCHWSSASLLITNWLSSWKSVVPMKHCSTIYSRLTLNFSIYFKCFCGINTVFPAKTNHCMMFNCFFHYNWWHVNTDKFTSCCEYVPHCEPFELKSGMREEGALLTNIFKFHGDCATSTMFSQHCRKIYQTDLVLQNFKKNLKQTW